MGFSQSQQITQDAAEWIQGPVSYFTQDLLAADWLSRTVRLAFQTHGDNLRKAHGMEGTAGHGGRCS